MVNGWKYATIGMALVTTTALGSTLAASRMIIPPAQAQFAESAVPVSSSRHVTVTRAATRPAVYTPAPARPVAVSTTATVGCEQKDKLLRVGKTGLVGTLVGAAVGAGGGAIADGGNGAMKGAAIGGLTGAAGGALYGLYQNKTTCGSILK